MAIRITEFPVPGHAGALLSANVDVLDRVGVDLIPGVYFQQNKGIL